MKTETRPRDYATHEEDCVTHANLSQWSHGDKGGLWRYTRVKERSPLVEMSNWVVLLWSGRVKWNDNQMGLWREMMFSGGRHYKMSVHWWEGSVRGRKIDQVGCRVYANFVLFSQFFCTSKNHSKIKVLLGVGEGGHRKKRTFKTKILQEGLVSRA